MKAIPVGLSRDLVAKRVMRADVQGLDVAVWRDPDEGLHAWNNRCPHRGMRLSHGFVRGDKLACLYHGWHYGKDGGCAYIPAHPDLDPPATISAVVYNVAEAAGVIWARADGEPLKPPQSSATTPLRSLAFDCAPKDALQALRATEFNGELPDASDDTDWQLGARRVAVYASELGESAALVHVCVDAGASLSALKALSRWCEAARRMAEAPRT